MFARIVLSTLLGLSVLAMAATPEITPKTTSLESQPANSLDQESIIKRGSTRGDEKLSAQYIPASICATFAGPVCPLVVALPAGASCACYYPGSTLPGIAR